MWYNKPWSDDLFLYNSLLHTWNNNHLFLLMILWADWPSLIGCSIPHAVGRQARLRWARTSGWLTHMAGSWGSLAVYRQQPLHVIGTSSSMVGGFRESGVEASSPVQGFSESWHESLLPYLTGHSGHPDSMGEELNATPGWTNDKGYYVEKHVCVCLWGDVVETILKNEICPKRY